MKVAPVYRTVLKSLSRACKIRPHFVQDIRFLLSLPLYSHHDQATVVPGTTTHAQNSTSLDITNSSDALENMHLLAQTTVDNYLIRPPSMAYTIDSNTLFALCYADLQSALRQPPQAPATEGEVCSRGGGSVVNPVAQQILRYRNLIWLRDRLARVLSDKTTEELATSLSVADGPDSEDFIPDTFFEAESETANLASETSSADAAMSQHGSTRSVSEGQPSADARHGSSSVTKAAKSASSPPAKYDAALFGSVVSAVRDENDPDVVFSAGAIGLQGEMFVLRHRESFPMAAQFLSGFPTVPAAELASCAHQQAALIRLVRDKYPTTVTCEDGHVSLSVAVEPFDPQYRTREHAGLGYFATAHRQFRVQFSLQPLALDGGVDGPLDNGTNVDKGQHGDLNAAGSDSGRGNPGLAEKTEVLVVNSYFARLDMEVMQVVEEVGYLHSRDVLRMLRVRDYGDHYSDFIGNAVTEMLSEGSTKSGASDDRSSSTTGTATEESAGGVRTRKGTSRAAAADSDDNARVFSLYFVNPTDAPMVLKGMLYYKLGKRNQLATAPVQCIPFGFVLLEA